MKRNYNELAAVVYADLFGYPLTVSEAKLWAIRESRKKISENKLILAKEITTWLQKIPIVEAIFLTGSVAAKNAKANADIDLMIITTPGTLWLTRLAVFLVLKKKNLYKSIVCPNIFLDTNHLEINEKNLYTAHEVLQARCLYDKSNINYCWLKQNDWTQEYLPKAYKFKIKNCKIENSLKIKNLKLKIIYLFEVLAFIFQYFYMKRKITNERVGWGFAFFHPRNLSEKVVGEFEKRLKDID